MKKRICAALAVLALLCAAMPVCLGAADPLSEYSDLDPDAWYGPGIRYCLSHGLMNGYGTRVRIFSADRPITRAQLVTILWRMDGSPEMGGLSIQYTDVPERRFFTEAVRWATATGIMDGYTYLTFAPEDSITREQLATILWRYAVYRGGAAATDDAGRAAYEDWNEVSGYAEEAMRWGCGMGVISGQKNRDGSVRLLPKEISSRASAATVLMRFCLDFGVFDDSLSATEGIPASG